MIEVTQLRAGTVFEQDGMPWVVLKYEHVKVGRGTATIKVKIRNLKSGAVLEKSFINGARVTEIDLEKRMGQFLYREGENLVFMNPTTFDQFEIAHAVVGEQAMFLKEGTEVDVRFYGEDPLWVNLPLKMTFRVTQTDPGYRGNSVTNLSKDAVIETGAQIKVPIFVEEGEEIVVNTETGEYVERVKSG